MSADAKQPADADLTTAEFDARWANLERQAGEVVCSLNGMYENGRDDVLAASLAADLLYGVVVWGKDVDATTRAFLDTVALLASVLDPKDLALKCQLEGLMCVGGARH